MAARAGEDGDAGVAPGPDVEPTHARAAAVGPVWTRPPKPESARLSLDAVLTTAIRLADAEGLGAVSVRRVASELNARPMSLYSFFARKDDLVDLMLDRIIGEMHLPELPADWQEALRAIARRTREVGHRHPWLMVVLSQRPSIGPNAVRHLEQSLAAVAGLGLSSERAQALLLAVDTYTIGSGAQALAEQNMQQRDGLSAAEWHISTETYFAGLIATGDFPQLARLGSAEVLRRKADAVFDDGLNWLLAGFAATLVEPGS